MSKKRSMSETVTVEDQQGALIETKQIDDINPSAENEDPNYANLFEAIKKIRKRADVIGYILKGESKATVDINDSTKIIEYAMLSSQTFETAKMIAAPFRLGDTETMVVECKNLKLLCLDLGQNTISIFMDKGSDHTDILKAFEPQTE